MVDPQELSALDNAVLTSPDLLGAECLACRRILPFKFYDRNASYQNGYEPTCIDCKAQPKLSMEEHLFRLKALNYHSEATKSQRHADQEEMRKVDARYGRRMHTSDLLLKLHKLVPSLYVCEGGIQGDLALYEVADQPQSKWGGKNFNYLGYIAYGELTEYDIHSFDEKLDVMIRTEQRGWRSVLLRFIREGLLTEQQANKEFGHPTSRGSALWYKTLKGLRQSKIA